MFGERMIKISGSEYERMKRNSEKFCEIFGSLEDLRNIPIGFAREFDVNLVVLHKDSWYNYCKILGEVKNDLRTQEENDRLKEENAKLKTDAEFWKYRYLKLRDELEEAKTDKNI